MVRREADSPQLTAHSGKEGILHRGRGGHRGHGEEKSKKGAIGGARRGRGKPRPYRRSEIGGARKGYGGKLKDLSLVSTQTLTTRVFWAFSGSLLAVGMGLKGLMATRTSTLVLEPSGDLALRML